MIAAFPVMAWLLRRAAWLMMHGQVSSLCFNLKRHPGKGAAFLLQRRLFRFVWPAAVLQYRGVHGYLAVVLDHGFGEPVERMIYRAEHPEHGRDDDRENDIQQDLFEHDALQWLFGARIAPPAGLRT